MKREKIVFRVTDDLEMFCSDEALHPPLKNAVWNECSQLVSYTSKTTPTVRKIPAI